MKTITVTTMNRHTNNKEDVIIIADKIISITDNLQGGKTLPTKINLVEGKKIFVCETKEQVQDLLK